MEKILELNGTLKVSRTKLIALLEILIELSLVEIQELVQKFLSIICVILNCLTKFITIRDHKKYTLKRILNDNRNPKGIF
jgi:hypothetical protein